MRPIHLTIQAFGPYAEKEEIDFSVLGNRNMFVISGKTGAGKTTIFDAISFAIYGKASGDERNGPDLRSHFAKPDLLTEVSLTFQLRNQIYSIYRSPMQERKKKSGDGFTSIGAKAELYEVTSEGKKILAGNVRDVDEKIKEIMGIDANQFKQILMIPQGEFKKLLISESKDKEVILQKLFHTSIYKKIEEKLKEDATNLKKLEEQLQHEIVNLMADIEWNDAEMLDNNLEQHSSFILTKLVSELEDNRLAIELFQKQLGDLEQTEKEYQKELFQAKEIIAKFQDKERLESEKDRMDQQKEHMMLLRKTVKEAQKASSLEKQEQAYLRIGKRLEEDKKHVDQLKLNRQQMIEKKVQCQKEYDIEESKKGEREQAASYVVQLQDMRQDVLAFSKLQQTVSLLKKEWEEAKQTRNTYEQQKEQLNQEKNKVEQLIQQVQDATVRYVEILHKQEKQEQVISSLQECIQLNKEYTVLQKQVNDQEAIVTKAKEEFKRENEKFRILEEALYRSHAAVLAAELKEGKPCAVCGSLTHPHPAADHAIATSQQEYEQQKEKVKKQEQLLQEYEQQLYRLQVNVENQQTNLQKQEDILKRKIPDFVTVEIEMLFQQFQEQNNQLKVELVQLAKQKNQLAELEKEKVNVQIKEEKLVGLAKQAQEIEDSKKEAFIMQSTKLEDMQRRLPEDLRSENQYEIALEKAQKERHRLEQQLELKRSALELIRQEEATIGASIETSEKNIQTLQVELDEQRELFRQEMSKQGFTSYQLYVTAKRNEQEVEQLQLQIERYDQEEQRVIHLLKNLSDALQGVEKPEIKEMEQRATELLQQLDEMRTKMNTMTNHMQHNQKIESKLKQAVNKQAEIQEKYETIGHLYEISKGQNKYRITFERFVLAAFLEDILKEANVRLRKMTSGRFQLLRKIDPTRRNIQSGLELTVFDQYTGTERHVKTLSGGESFKASLSLALGLAAVVQQNAGGISLETMFIDEGFGTLDPESLDQAIEALLDIQSGGRLVGIISHVPELKERIDARLEVIATQNGSTTKFILN